MSAKALFIWIVVVAAIVGGVLAMHGEGHRMLVRWLPSIHGGTR